MSSPNTSWFQAMPRMAKPRKVYTGGEWRDARVIRRESLKPGHRVAGPALIIEPNQTIVIEPGWEARINGARPRRADPLRKT